MPLEISKLVGYAAVNFPEAKVGASKVVGYAAMDAEHAQVYASVVVAYAAMVPPPPALSVGVEVAVLVGYAAAVPPISVGRSLAYAGDTWTFAPSAIAAQWRRDGAPILGATGPSYLLAVEDVGAMISVALIASNASGPSEAVVSAEVGPVRA